MTVISALLFFMPFGQHAVTNFFLLLVLINALISLKPSEWLSALKDPVFYLPASFIMYLAITLFWSNERADGLAQLETKATLFIAPLVLTASRNYVTHDSLSKLLRAFVWGNVSVMILAFGLAGIKAISAGSWYFISEGGTVPHSYFAYKSLAGPIMHPGYLSTYVGLGILVVIFLLLKFPEFRKWHWYSALLLLLYSLFMLQGRINVIALLIVFIGGAITVGIRQRAYKWLSLALLPIVLLGILLTFGSENLKRRYFQPPDMSYDITADASEFNSATYRLAEWSCAMDAIAERPLTGAGLGSNRIALQEAYENRNFRVGLENKFNAHNQYLEVMLAGGFIGIFLFLVYITGYFVIAIKSRNYLFPAAWLFFLLCMLTESMLERVWAVILCSILFPLLLLQPKSEVRESES